LGIIDQSMIAARPKRLKDFSGGWTRRLARNHVSVHLHLDETLDRAHPLAPLASWNWQMLVDQSEPAARIRGTRPSYLRLVVDNTESAGGEQLLGGVR
jgi:hypothetical protein